MIYAMKFIWKWQNILSLQFQVKSHSDHSSPALLKRQKSENSLKMEDCDLGIKSDEIRTTFMTFTCKVFNKMLDKIGTESSYSKS